MKPLNMKTPITILAFLGLLIPTLTTAQERYGSRTGHVAFFSSTPVENIEANNYKAASVYDATSGAMEFSVLIKGFEFEKALMQEHFNENYMESNTYPKAVFKGKVVGITAADLKKPGKYDVTVEGDLTMHGVTRKITEKGAISVEPTGAVKAESQFNVKAEDYTIEIPSVVRKQIAEQIQVKVRIDYQKM
jgi:polyisoprenoid-binding protein YceI